MKDFPEHPEIARALRNGYPFDEEEFDQDAWEEYGDRCHDGRREEML